MALQIQLKDAAQRSMGSGFVPYLGEQRWDRDLKKKSKPYPKTTRKKPHKQI